MKPDKLVSNEIYYNVSMLVNELAQDEKYMDELLPVLISDDYRTALEEHPDLPEFLEWANSFGVSVDELSDEEVIEICNRWDIEPYTNEALEHWIVSDYLAQKLEEAGEMVVYDFLGLTIWGRTSSGQHISMDGVIQKIAD